MKRFTVYEVCADNARFIQFESNDGFECEVYVAHHQYDRKFLNTTPNHSRLEIEDCFL